MAAAVDLYNRMLFGGQPPRRYAIAPDALTSTCGVTTLTLWERPSSTPTGSLVSVRRLTSNFAANNVPSLVTKRRYPSLYQARIAWRPSSVCSPVVRSRTASCPGAAGAAASEDPRRTNGREDRSAAGQRKWKRGCRVEPRWRRALTRRSLADRL